MQEGTYLIEMKVIGPDGKKFGVKVPASEGTYSALHYAASDALRRKIEEVYHTEIGIVAEEIQE